LLSFDFLSPPPVGPSFFFLESFFHILFSPNESTYAMAQAFLSFILRASSPFLLPPFSYRRTLKLLHLFFWKEHVFFLAVSPSPFRLGLSYLKSRSFEASLAFPVSFLGSTLAAPFRFLSAPDLSRRSRAFPFKTSRSFPSFCG